MDEANSEEQTHLYSDLIDSDDQSPSPNPPVKRAFCERCKKAQKMCICDRFKGGVIRNRTKVTILQSLEERNHPIGSARVALLGLENVSLVEVPEIHYSGTFRIRPKVPGSKRCLSGRGGKKHKGPKPLLAHGAVPSDSQLSQLFQLLINIFGNWSGLLTFDAFRSFMHSDGQFDDMQPNNLSGICRSDEGCMNGMPPNGDINYMLHKDDGSKDASDNGCMDDMLLFDSMNASHPSNDRNGTHLSGNSDMRFNGMPPNGDLNYMHHNDDGNKNASDNGCMDYMHPFDSMNVSHPSNDRNGTRLSDNCDMRLHGNNGMHQRGNNDAHLHDSNGLHLSNNNDLHLQDGNGVYPSNNNYLHLQDGNGVYPSNNNDLHLQDGNVVYPSNNNGAHVQNNDSMHLGNNHCMVHLRDSNGAISNGDISQEVPSGLSDDEVKALIPPGVALLYPSDKAIELSDCFSKMGINNDVKDHPPSHLIVLDGTWPKARRIYFNNPWLQKIPHYKLSPSSVSLYAGVRKEPKPECLSTIESIVFALKALEPETLGLDGLLEVFDSMVEDQRWCKETKSSTLGPWFYKDC